jgi:hypothetical protein
MKEMFCTSQDKVLLNPVCFQQPAHKLECKVFTNVVACANMKASGVLTFI